MSAVLPLPAASSSPWRPALAALGVVLLALLLMYRETFAAMVGIWARSDTFAHAFLVPPIVLWLVWRRRDVLRTIAPRPLPMLLLPMALAALAWWLGDIAGVNALTQLAATTLLVLSVPALLGAEVGRRLLFPLAFLFFMVPVGEFALPLLMQWTADVTVASLRLFGIPVFREGLQFVIPSGTWSVVEACSGVRYLIASFMVGTLYAYLNYRSLRRRLLFSLLSLAVPVVANWVRAVMIVLLGHLSGNQLAVGVDHLIYGWLFFGVVVGLMYFIGARWAEVPPAAAPAAPAASVPRRAAALWATAAAAVVLLLLPPLQVARADAAPRSAPRLALPALPDVPAAASPASYRPVFEGSSAEVVGVYGSGDAAVTVHVAYYRQQTYGHKLVNSQNTLLRSDDHAWHRTAGGEREFDLGGRRIALRTAELRPSAGGARLQVRQVYWVDGQLTTSDPLAVLLALRGRLAGRGDDAAAITFYAAGDDGRAVDDFVARHLDDLVAWLAAAARATR